MEISAEVWVREPNSEECWLRGSIAEKHIVGNVCKFLVLVAGSTAVQKEIVHKLADGDEIADLKLRNSDDNITEENLINLPHLHEPALLEVLQRRYDNGSIYSYTGPILIAINPFKPLPLYTTSILEKYYAHGIKPSSSSSSSSSSGPLAPHVYAIADAAYRSMMLSLDNSSNGPTVGSIRNDQTILISGESGAGKTETTKIVLRYLTTVGNPQGVLEVSEGSVMDKILQSNPILGNPTQTYTFSAVTSLSQQLK